MVTRDRHGERGVTFMECIVSLAIIGFLASSVIVARSRDFRFARESHDRTAALRVCTGRFEEYAAGAAAPVPGERVVDLPAVLRKRFPDAIATETVRPAGEGLVEVTVAVRWRAAGGAEREAHLATLVALPPEAGR